MVGAQFGLLATFIMQQAPSNIGDVLKQLQGIFARQPPGIGGPLVAIGGPTATGWQHY
jgi:hypothetical protein